MTTPIAESEMAAGLDAVREKLEEIVVNALATQFAFACEPHAYKEPIIEDVVDEILALLESKQGKQVRRDHEAMNVLREKPGDLMWFGMSDNRASWHSYVRNQMNEEQPSRKRPAHDPADAILGTPTESGENDE